MKTIKIKLAFSPEVQNDKRKEKLISWANVMVNGSKIHIIEEKHMPNMSYIVIKNSKILNLN